MGYIVSSKDINSITLNETDPVRSILQNIAIILSTPKFSVPLYRDFGLPMTFIDKPMVAARPMMIAEIRDAISEYEPRVDVLNITFEEESPGKLMAKVEVEIIDG